jgi:hypothetical protein
MPQFRVLRPFANGHPDRIVHPGDVITVNDENRSRALADNALVEPIHEEKAAPAPQNKMAPPVPNKAAPAPIGRQGRR